MIEDIFGETCEDGLILKIC